jgi:hypothetical protein
LEKVPLSEGDVLFDKEGSTEVVRLGVLVLVSDLERATKVGDRLRENDTTSEMLGVGD